MPRKKEYDIDSVVDKAMLTFWANGYERTSVRMLEKDMGINQFSMYASFGNKHDLFIEVLKKYKGHVKKTFLSSLLDSVGRLEDLRRFLLDFGGAISTGENPNGCLMVNSVMEIGKNDTGISEELVRYFNFIKITFYDFLEKAKLKGELPSAFDSMKNAGFLLGSLQGLTLYAKYYSEAEIKEFVDSIFEVIK